MGRDAVYVENHHVRIHAVEPRDVPEHHGFEDLFQKIFPINFGIVIYQRQLSRATPGKANSQLEPNIRLDVASAGRGMNLTATLHPQQNSSQCVTSVTVT